MDSLPHYVGPDQLATQKKVAILNSRQSKYPVGDDAWVKSTGQAVKFARDNGLVVLTSIGMNTWELVLTFASKFNAATLLVIPAPKCNHPQFIETVEDRFHLDRSKVGFIFLDRYSSSRKREWWPQRDCQIAQMADTIIPVSVRKGGNLRRLLNLHPQKVNPNFTLLYEKPVRSRPRYDRSEFSFPIWDHDLIVHFTRTNCKPWPGETDYDFYGSIINSKSDYCYCARNTLLKILKSRIIYGSAKNIKGGYRAVGFTSLSKESPKNLFRYRPRLLNPGFEPYGVSLKRIKAQSLGIRPVIYGDPSIYPLLDEFDKPFFQNVGSHGSQWRAENEWRFVGNFDFRAISDRDLTILAPSAEEAEIISQCTDIKVLPIFEPKSE
jgi:hypothetical protein